MEDRTALTPLEVANILKISKNTVYELVKRGDINSYRVGNKLRIGMNDIEEYKNRANKNQNNLNKAVSSSEALQTAQGQNGVGFVICGQDIMLDILSRYLQQDPRGVQVLRSYVGSYNGLFELYNDNVQIATAHLWDSETGQYNTPYVKRMLPGIPAIIIHLAKRMQGFYVAKGNPKSIKGWEDLKRTDISIINREKGSGTRILLDEHLKKLRVTANNLSGYKINSFSHLGVASTVSRGGADFGIGNEKTSEQVKGIDFIPLQMESYELVIKKEDIDKPYFQAVLQIIRSKEFKQEIEGIGGYDLENLGEVSADTSLPADLS